MTEERLREAARQAGKAIIDSLPAPEDCTHTFSLKHQKKMKHLLRRAKRPSIRPALRVACMLLVCLLGCGTFFQVNAEAREIFLGWVSRLEEGAQHYFFSGEPTAEDTPIHYSLNDLPDGYRLYDMDDSNEHEIIMVYANERGQFLRFGYLGKETNTASSDLFFLTEGAEKQSVLVHGKDADFYMDETGNASNLIVWTDDDTDFLLYISAYLNKEDLIRLAEKVQCEPLK